MKSLNLPDDVIRNTPEEKNEIVIRWYRSDRNTHKNKIVLHRNMINLLISGTKTIVYPKATITVRDGEFVILSTGNILTSEILPGSDVFSSMIIYFSNELLTRFLIKYAALLKGDEEKRDRSPFLIYSKDAFISNYIQSLQVLLESSSAMAPEIRQLKLEELLLYLLYMDPGKLGSLEIVSKGDEEIQLRKTVENNIGKPITIGELAFLCNMSPSTFKRRFARLYGMSPQKWFHLHKMQAGANLLKDPTERPGMVFQKLGYENQSSFSEAFKQHYGITPSEYQAQNLAVRP
jgi:AraC-like DNA-binding protein